MVENGSKNNPKSKNYEAYRAIKEMILGQHLLPGQKLIYRDLEERLGMSKTPIINGLLMLENEHLVVSEKNRGFHIRYVNRREAEHIYGLREKLEEIAVEYAVVNHDKRDLSLLKRKMLAYRRVQGETCNPRQLSLDVDFHIQIAAMGKNPFFVQIIKQFYASMCSILKIVSAIPGVDRFKEEHERLYHAIKRRDLEEAKRVAREHTRGTRDILIQVMPD